MGFCALFFNATGNNNIAIGENALYNNSSSQPTTTNKGNIAIGWSAGCNNVTGYNNIYIGNNAQQSGTTSCNQIVIGTTQYTGQYAPSPTWSSVSDARDKTDIEVIPLGLDFLMEVRPVKFTWKLRNTDASHPRFGMLDSGFIAQELADTASKYGVNEWLKITSGEGTEQMYADSGRLLPVTVKAVQELAVLVDTLTARVATLEGKIQQLGG
jgi:hypothetical protein